MQTGMSALGQKRTTCCAKTTAGTPVNTKCPISGMPADPGVTTVSGNKTVAFCCGGCIGKWNKLPSDEKSKKLAAAK